MKREGYQPTPEEIKKGEEMMTPKQETQSEMREYRVREGTEDEDEDNLQRKIDNVENMSLEDFRGMIERLDKEDFLRLCRGVHLVHQDGDYMKRESVEKLPGYQFVREETEYGIPHRIERWSLFRELSSGKVLVGTNNVTSLYTG